MNRWTLILMIIVLALIIGVLLLPMPYYSSTSPLPLSSNEEIRAAMDIGSGATNLKVAKVDRNTNKIITKIFEKSIPVPYQKHLEQSGNNTFDEEVMQQGINAIKVLKDLANEHQAKKVVAVATAAFRQASNARQFAQEVERQTGVVVRIIDQDEEGILAFRGALANTSFEPEQVVVWDIGGGSMQLTAITDSGSYLVDKGRTASIPFKNMVIQEVKHQNIQEQATPNPLSLEEMQQALRYAHQAASAVDPYIKERIHQPQIQVLAVGSLFNYGIRPLAKNPPTITQPDLEQATRSLAGKSDEELGQGSLSEIAVTNPLLVLGYMQALDIQGADIVSVNNADGVLSYPAYWE